MRKERGATIAAGSSCRDFQGLFSFSEFCDLSMSELRVQITSGRDGKCPDG